MSRSAEITLAFGGEDRTFRLPLGRLRVLQERTDCGPMELLRRFSAGTWRVDDVRETFLQGLIGGGLDQGRATKLVQQTFDDQPIQPFVPLAEAIVMVVVVGAPDEDDAPDGEGLGEPEGETTNRVRPSPTPCLAESSPSPGSTAPAP